MNIGIVVCSQTGHTLSVAQQLQEALAAAEHTVSLERVGTAGARSAIDAYDALVLATGVQGGEPAPPMASFLAQLPCLQGKNVACLATGFFPVAGWGRDQTLAKMQEVCEIRGATVCGSGSVGWFSLNRKRQIVEVVEALSGLF
jgi:flavodoxin